MVLLSEEEAVPGTEKQWSAKKKLEEAAEKAKKKTDKAVEENTKRNELM